MSENSNSANENSMRWLDLSKYGIDFKISPAIEGVRDKACILHINDVEKFLSTTGRNPNQLGQLIVDSNFKLYPSETANKTPNQLTLVYDLEYNPLTPGTRLHLPDIVNFVGCKSKDNLDFVELPMSAHIFKTDSKNTEEWRSVLQDLSQKVADTTLYRPKNNLPDESLTKAVERLKKDTHPLFIRNYIDDPLPFNELSALGYASNVISTVYPSLKQAQDAGYSIDDLDVIQPTKDKVCPLPFGVNKDGSINIVNDVRKVPELFNYSPKNHQPWIDRFELPSEVEHLVSLSADIREISTTPSNPTNEDELEVHFETVSMALSRINKFAKSKPNNRHSVRFNRRSQTMLLKNPNDNRWYHCERLDGKYTHKDFVNPANYAHIMRVLCESSQALTRSIDQNRNLVDRIRPLHEKVISQNVENFVKVTSDLQQDLDMPGRKPHQRVLDKQVNAVEAPSSVNQSQDNILKMIQSVPDNVAKQSSQDVNSLEATSTSYVAAKETAPTISFTNPHDTPEMREKMAQFNADKAAQIRQTVEEQRQKIRQTMTDKEVENLVSSSTDYVPAQPNGAKGLAQATEKAQSVNASPAEIVAKEETKQVVKEVPLETLAPSKESEFAQLKANVDAFAVLPKGFHPKADAEYEMASALYQYRQQLNFIELPIAKQRVQEAQRSLDEIDASENNKVASAIKDFCKNPNVDLLQSALETSEARNEALRKLDAARYEESVVKGKLNNTNHQFQKRYVEVNPLEAAGHVRSPALENQVMDKDANGNYRPFEKSADYQNTLEKAGEAYLRLANHADYKPLEHKFVQNLDNVVRNELASYRPESVSELSILSKGLHQFEKPVSLLQENVVVPKSAHPFVLEDMHKRLMEISHLYINEPNHNTGDLVAKDIEKISTRVDSALAVMGRTIQRQQEALGEKIDFFNDPKVTAVLENSAQSVTSAVNFNKDAEHQLPLSLKSKLDALEKITATSISTRAHLGYIDPKDAAKENWQLASNIANLTKGIDYDRLNKVSPEFEKTQVLNFVLNNVAPYPEKQDPSIKSPGWSIQIDGKDQDYKLKLTDLSKSPDLNEVHLKSKDYQSALSESFAIYRKNWVLNELNISKAENALINSLVYELKQPTINEEQIKQKTKQLLGSELTSLEIKEAKDFSISTKELNEFTKVQVGSFDSISNPAFKDLPINQAQSILDRLNLTNRLAFNAPVNDPLIEHATKPSDSFEQLKNYFTPNSQEQKLSLSSPALEDRTSYAKEVSKFTLDEYQRNSLNLITSEEAKNGAITVVTYQPKNSGEVAFSRAFPLNLDMFTQLKYENKQNLIIDNAYSGETIAKKIEQAVESTFIHNNQSWGVFPKIASQNLGAYATPLGTDNLTEKQKEALKCKINDPNEFMAVTTANLLASVISHEVALQNMSPALTDYAKDFFSKSKENEASERKNNEYVQIYLSNSNQSDSLPTLRISSAYEETPKDAVVVGERVNLKEFLQEKVFVAKDKEFDPQNVTYKSVSATRDFKTYLDEAGFDFDKFLSKVNPLIQAEIDLKEEHLKVFEKGLAENKDVNSIYVDILQHQLDKFKESYPELNRASVSTNWGDGDLPRIYVQPVSQSDDTFHSHRYIGGLNVDATKDDIAKLVSQNQEVLNPKGQKVLFDNVENFSFEVKGNTVTADQVKNARDFFIGKMCELHSDEEMVRSIGLKGAQAFIQKNDDVVTLAIAGSNEKGTSLKKEGFHAIPYDGIENLAFPLNSEHEPLRSNPPAIAQQITEIVKNYEIPAHLQQDFPVNTPAEKPVVQERLIGKLISEALFKESEVETIPLVERGNYMENQGKTFKYSQLLDIDNATATEALTKNNLWKPVDVVQAAQNKYMDMDAYLLAETIRSSLPNKPIYTDMNDPAQVQRDRIYFHSLITNTFKAVADSQTLPQLVENLNKAQPLIIRESSDASDQRKKYQLEVLSVVASSPKEADRVLGINRNNDDMSIGLKYVNNPALNQAWNNTVQKFLANETINENSKSFVSMFNKFELNAPLGHERNALSDALYARVESKEPQNFAINLDKYIVDTANPIVSSATKSHVDVVNTVANKDYVAPEIGKDNFNISFGPGATNLSVSFTEKVKEHFKAMDDMFDMPKGDGALSNFGTSISFKARTDSHYDNSSDTIVVNAHDPNVNMNKFWAKALDHKLFEHEYKQASPEQKQALDQAPDKYLSMALSQGYEPSTNAAMSFAKLQHFALGKSQSEEMNFSEAHSLVAKGVEAKQAKLNAALDEIRKDQPEVAKFVEWSIQKGLELNDRLNTKIEGRMAKDYKVHKDDHSIHGYNDALNEVNKRIDNIKLSASSLNVGMAVKANYPNESNDFKHEVTDKLINFASLDKADQLNVLFTDYLASKQTSDAMELINKHAPDALKGTHALCTELANTYIGSYVGLTSNGVKSEAVQQQTLSATSINDINIEHDAVANTISNLVAVHQGSLKDLSVSDSFRTDYSEAIRSLPENHTEMFNTLKSTIGEIKPTINEPDSPFRPKTAEKEVRNDADGELEKKKKNTVELDM